MNANFRTATDHEFSIFRGLLGADFPGRDVISSMLRNALVRTIDANGSLEIQTQVPGTARVIKPVPVEAEATDEDGVTIHALLHVLQGRPVELEIYKEDGSNVRRMPDASAFRLIVLPPYPQS